MNEWKTDVLSCPFPRAGDHGDIVSVPVHENLGTSFHARMPKGAALRELQDVHLHLSYWEAPYYEKAVRELMAEELDPEKSVVADIGCGDGRLTVFLLESGFQKVVAVDADRRPLESLALYARERGFQERLLLIHASAMQLPLKPQCLDGALAIGVFYYLNEAYEDAFREATSKLRPAGILVQSEPDLEGAIYKSAIFEGVDDIIENYYDRIFKEEKGETPFKFRLFAREDMPGFLREHGMECRDSRSISLLPSIVRIKMVRGELDAEDVADREEKLRAVMDYLSDHGQIAKHRLWKSVKL